MKGRSRRSHWSVYRWCLFHSIVVVHRLAGRELLFQLIAKHETNIFLASIDRSIITHIDQFSTEEIRRIQRTEEQRFQDPFRSFVVGGCAGGRYRLLDEEWLVQRCSLFHNQEIILQKQLIDIGDMNQLPEMNKFHSLTELRSITYDVVSFVVR